MDSSHNLEPELPGIIEVRHVGLGTLAEARPRRGIKSLSLYRAQSGLA